MKIQRHNQLDVYCKANDVAMLIFEASTTFPKAETYSLIDQMRRSSRSVCANVAEAWRKRRYVAAFIAKLSDAEGEAAETQVWIEFAVKCGCLDHDQGVIFYRSYEEILRMLVAMIHKPQPWLIPKS